MKRKSGYTLYSNSKVALIKTKEQKNEEGGETIYKDVIRNLTTDKPRWHSALENSKCLSKAARQQRDTLSFAICIRGMGAAKD